MIGGIATLPSKAALDRLLETAPKCTLCKFPVHYIGRCPVIVNRERNEVLDAAIGAIVGNHFACDRIRELKKTDAEVSAK